LADYVVFVVYEQIIFRQKQLSPTWKELNLDLSLLITHQQAMISDCCFFNCTILYWNACSYPRPQIQSQTSGTETKI